MMGFLSINIKSKAQFGQAESYIGLGLYVDHGTRVDGSIILELTAEG